MGASDTLELPPGVELVATLAEDLITTVAWSPGGERLAALSLDACTVFEWPDHSQRRTFKTRSGEEFWHPERLDWAPDGNRFLVGHAFAGEDRLRLFDMQTRDEHLQLDFGPRTIFAWSPDGTRVMLGLPTGLMLVSTPPKAEVLRRLSGPRFSDVSWSPDGDHAALTSADKLYLWFSGEETMLQSLQQHQGIRCPTWSPDGQLIATLTSEGTISIWDTEQSRELALLDCPEARRLAFSPDGRILASIGPSHLRLWATNSWKSVGEPIPVPWINQFSGLAFHPVETLLAVDRYVLRLDIDHLLLYGTPGNRRYRNAKVVLLGDSGVGKSGLSLRLLGRSFAATESSHAREIRRLWQAVVPTEHGPERRELILWDMAGQPGYRLVHQLHLHDVAVALVLFDARDETDPFAGVRHWARALEQARAVQGPGAPPLPMFLVSARVDRGGVGVSQARIEALLRELGFSRAFDTSAKTGRGVDELRAAIRGAIQWDRLPIVSSDALVEELRELVEALPDELVLLTTDALFERFCDECRQASRECPDRSAFAHALRSLWAHGLVSVFSFGDLVLLRPELLDAYASWLVIAVRDEPDGFGSILESDAFTFEFVANDDQRIASRKQEHDLLAATIEQMLDQEIALREPVDGGSLLVFPSQLTRPNPHLPDPPGKAVVFTFGGAIRNHYATLVVRLSHSGHYRPVERWHNAVEYEDEAKGTAGIALFERDEGTAELVVFFGDATHVDSRLRFLAFVEGHLRSRAAPGGVQRRDIEHCPRCGNVLPEPQVRFRRAHGHDTILCGYCEARVQLRDPPPVDQETARALDQMVRHADAMRQRSTAIVAAAAELGTPQLRTWMGSELAPLTVVVLELESPSGDLDAIEQHARATGGRTIQRLPAGMLAAFLTPSNALDFARSLPAGSSPRTGLHHADLRTTDGDALRRLVDMAARVQSTAAPGQVRASQAFVRALPDPPGQKWTLHALSDTRGFGRDAQVWSLRPTP